MKLKSKKRTLSFTIYIPETDGGVESRSEQVRSLMTGSSPVPVPDPQPQSGNSLRLFFL